MWSGEEQSEVGKQRKRGTIEWEWEWWRWRVQGQRNIYDNRRKITWKCEGATKKAEKFK